MFKLDDGEGDIGGETVDPPPSENWRFLARGPPPPLDALVELRFGCLPSLIFSLAFLRLFCVRRPLYLRFV